MKCCAGDLSNAAAEVRTATCPAAELRNFDIELLRGLFRSRLPDSQNSAGEPLENIALLWLGTIELYFSQTKVCFNSRGRGGLPRWGGTLRGSWSYSRDRK